jgi:hydrogenase nickel incorporation protein HypA/HybF
MHEFSTMASIVDAVKTEAGKHHADRVLEVTLEIGALTFLNEEQLRFAFEILTADSEMAGALLTIESVPPSVRCDCGYTGDTSYEAREGLQVHIPLLRCPSCGDSVCVVKGRECYIKDIKIEVEDVPPAR